jgi:two-component system CheB/CheR fusion protein
MVQGRPRRQMSVSAAAPSASPGDGARLIAATASRVVDLIRQPLVILDEEFHVVFPNLAFCQAFALSRDEIIGRPVTSIGHRCLDVGDFRDFLGLLLASDATVEDHELSVDMPELGTRVLLASGRQIHDGPSTAREILVTIEDITERRRSERSLLAAKLHSDRASLAKSRILSAASHDLRQPLQSLNLMRATLAKSIKDKEGLSLIRQLDKTSEAMLSMLNTLLETNQLEAGIVDPREVEFPINALLEQLRTEFTYHAQERDLRWRVVPCSLSVRSDPRLLEQMLRNLLSNAMKYTKQGKVLLGCRRRAAKLRIEIWDTGIGIAEDQLHAIFAEFHQPGNPAHDAALGFGLGLPIVQRLGHLLGHAVHVHSRPGKGSVFAIEVTRVEMQPQPTEGHTATEAAPRQGPSLPAATGYTVPLPTIFIVDDEGALRDAMRELLQAEGWSVEAYPSGEAFLEAYRPGGEGCLVVDARMPGMSGLELLERLKSTNGAPPAIMVTGHADIRLAVRAMKAGAMAFLEKPVPYDELIVNIERALALTRNATALSSLREAAAKRLASLTTRERQVVGLVVEGNLNKEVAYLLGISQRTVETHRAAAMKKLGARTLSELIHLTMTGSPLGT